MYAITGITGHVGSALANALLDGKLPIRAIVRDEIKGRVWETRGAEVAVANMEDAASLAKAFDGAEGVFILLPPCFDPEPGFPESRNLISNIKLALEMAVPEKVVCLSTVGAQVTEPNLLNQLGIMEKELSTLSMPVAFIRAAWFMENAAWDIEPAKKTGIIPSFLQPLDRKIPMVATVDIGVLAAKVLKQSWKGIRVIELQGPDLVSPNDIASVFTQSLGKPIQMEVVPKSNWEVLFTEQGMKHPLPRMQMLDGFNAGWIKFEGEFLEQVVGDTDLSTVLNGLIRN